MRWNDPRKVPKKAKNITLNDSVEPFEGDKEDAFEGHEEDSFERY